MTFNKIETNITYLHIYVITAKYCSEIPQTLAADEKTMISVLLNINHLYVLTLQL